MCFFFNYAHTCNLNYQGVYGFRLVPQPHYIYWVGGYIHNMQARSQEVWRGRSIYRTAGGGGGGGGGWGWGWGEGVGGVWGVWEMGVGGRLTDPPWLRA